MKTHDLETMAVDNRLQLLGGVGRNNKYRRMSPECPQYLDFIMSQTVSLVFSLKFELAS
jgi:hypothetical protein